MGLEELKKEIIEKAEKEASRIISLANISAGEVMKQADLKIKDMMEKAQREAEKQAEAMERKELAKAGLESKKKVLAKKQDLIDKAFAHAMHEIKKLPVEKNRHLLAKLAEKASRQMEISTLYINKKDMGIANSLGQAGKSSSWLNAGIIGGLIAENSDRTVRVDYSFDTLLENVRSRHLSEVAHILFRE